MIITTTLQDEVVTNLEARGFRRVRQFEVDEDNPPSTIVLLVKSIRFIQFHAEVEADGAVNGMVLGAYLKDLKQRINETITK
ncbi:MAG: hypothetical protein WB586_08300 [Chthoniobacterales bacterium]